MPSNQPLSITFNGVTRTGREWDRARGFPLDTVAKRISAGMTEREAITTPYHSKSMAGRKGKNNSPWNNFRFGAHSWLM